MNTTAAQTPIPPHGIPCCPRCWDSVDPAAPYTIGVDPATPTPSFTHTRLHTILAGTDPETGGDVRLTGPDEEFEELRDTLLRLFPLPVPEPRKTRVLEQVTFHKDQPPTREYLFQRESEIINDDGSRNWETLHTRSLRPDGQGRDVAAAKQDEIIELKKQLEAAEQHIKIVRAERDQAKQEARGIADLHKTVCANIKTALDAAGAPTLHPLVCGCLQRKPMMPHERIEALGTLTRTLADQRDHTISQHTLAEAEIKVARKMRDDLATQAALLREANDRLTNEAIGLRELQARLSGQSQEYANRLCKIRDILV